MTQAALERAWKRCALSLARRYNIAWWLERFNALLLIVLIPCALLVLLARAWRAEGLRAEWVLPTGGGLLFLMVFLAYRLARPRFVGLAEGLASLDERLGLHNRLVSAAAQVGAWPEVPPGDRREIFPRWNATRAWLPAVSVGLLLLTAWWIPLPPESTRLPASVVEPAAWEQMNRWVETLEATELIEEEALKEWSKRIETLREQAEENWFSHASLEATDTLHQTLSRELLDFRDQLGALEQQLAQMSATAESPPAAAGEDTGDPSALEKLLSARSQTGLPLEESVAEKLRQLDPSSLALEGPPPGMDAEKLASLQEKLSQAGQALGSMEGLPPLEKGPQGQGTALAGAESGAQGDINRGPGEAPLSFGSERKAIETGEAQGLQNEDLSRITLGDLQGLGETEHSDDRPKWTLQEGGRAASLGQGGKAVSREVLLPEEQAVLKRYFR